MRYENKVVASVLGLGIAALLAIFIPLYLQRVAGHHRLMGNAITAVAGAHTPRIASTLREMRRAESAQVEDAVFDELKTGRSISLLTRLHVKVRPTPDGPLECAIDLSEFNLPPRVIPAADAP